MLWEEAAEAVVHTIVHTIRAAIHIRAVHTDRQALRTILQDLLTDLRDLHTGPQVLRTRTIPAVHTGPEAVEVLAEGVSTAEEAAA